MGQDFIHRACAEKNPVTFSGEKQKKLAYRSENSGKSARRRRTFWKIDVI